MQVVTEETVEIEVVDAEVVAAPEADPTAGAEPETDLPRSRRSPATRLSCGRYSGRIIFQFSGVVR